jgi:hypothetical protein
VESIARDLEVPEQGGCLVEVVTDPLGRLDHGSRHWIGDMPRNLRATTDKQAAER